MPIPPNPSEDTSLTDDFECARLGSIAARNRIFEVVNPSRYLLKIAQDEINRHRAHRIDPADVVQDTLTHGVKYFASFWGDSRKELRFWLRRTLRFKLLSAQRDASRRARREVPLTAGEAQRPAPTPTPPQQLEHQEAHTEMERLLAKVSSADQQIIRLRIFDNWSFEDLGDLLHCSANAAQKRFVRAFQRLWFQKITFLPLDFAGRPRFERKQVAEMAS